MALIGYKISQKVRKLIFTFLYLQPMPAKIEGFQFQSALSPNFNNVIERLGTATRALLLGYSGTEIRRPPFFKQIF